MAMKLLYWFLLWGLIYWIKDVTCLCNVSCTTDYETLLECSCSASSPVSSLLVEAKCSGEEVEVHGNCEINPPQSSCLIRPDNFIAVTSIETICTATVNNLDSPTTDGRTESTSWVLAQMVKMLPPFDVQVTSSVEAFNISWEVENYFEYMECLQYRVRIRFSEDLSNEAGNCTLVQDKQYLSLAFDRLLPYTSYAADIQASFCSDVYAGPWSPWSSVAEWKSSRTAEGFEAKEALWLYGSLVAVCVLGSVIFWKVASGSSPWKPFCLKKIQLITFVPDPEIFFKPLYHTYEGNFKDWVRPAFSEYDVLSMTSPFQMCAEKPQALLRALRYGQVDDDERVQTSSPCGEFPRGSSFSLDCSARRDTGHLSIYAVFLPGEDEPEEREAAPGRPLELRGSREQTDEGRTGAGVGGSAQQGTSRADPEPLVIEPERVSLDSLLLNEQSDDGYPHVDLDTVDSGFGESDCSSPANSETNSGEQVKSAFFSKENITSNYVSQWMLCSARQDDVGHQDSEALSGPEDQGEAM